jgi:hypothetical protein
VAGTATGGISFGIPRDPGIKLTSKQNWQNFRLQRQPWDHVNHLCLTAVCLMKSAFDDSVSAIFRPDGMV